MSSFLKDPQSVLDYRFDWAALTNGFGVANWLATGEAIIDFTITVTGLTLDSASTVSDDTAVVAWLSGGTVGEFYNVTCHIVTSAGREDDRTMSFRLVER